MRTSKTNTHGKVEFKTTVEETTYITLEEKDVSSIIAEWFADHEGIEFKGDDVRWPSLYEGSRVEAHITVTVKKES